MTVAAIIMRAEAEGVRLRRSQDGRVRMEAARPPPPDLLADLRQHREAVAALLAERERAAFLARAAEDAAAALAVPDPDLAHERAEVAAAQAVEARGEYGRPKPEADHRAALAGSLAAGLQRPPAWTDPASLPPPGAWCGCCGRFSRTGGRWWREAVNPTGWRCWTCHPPVHLAPGAVVERQT